MATLARTGAAGVAVEGVVGLIDFPSSSFSTLAAPIPLILIPVDDVDAAGGTVGAIEGGGGEVGRGCSSISPSSASRETGIRAILESVLLVSCELNAESVVGSGER